jgi:hypothetical protein
MAIAGRPWRRALAMSQTMRSGSVPTWSGLTWITEIPAAVSLACRRMVASQVAASKCHSRESISTATPACGHHASTTPSSTPSRNSLALNRGCGKSEDRTSAWKSPSAADRTPSATSASTARRRAEPLMGPATSSSVNCEMVQRRFWTALPTTARASGRLSISRTASATALAGSANRRGPSAVDSRGSRLVRCMTTKPRLTRLSSAGMSMSTNSVSGPRMT